VLHEFTNSDWASSASDQRSTSGYCFNLGSVMVYEFSRKQFSVALSSTRQSTWQPALLVVKPSSFAKLLAELRSDFEHYCDLP
jgi:hypothetical protein